MNNTAEPTTPGYYCGYEGNNDLYGLGLRLAVYLQYLATLLAKIFLPTEFKYLQGSILVFITANFIVLAREAGARSLRASEVFILMWELVPLFGPATQFGVVNAQQLVMNLPLGAFTFFMEWFWFVGIDTLPLTRCDDEWGFFFARVSLRGGFRTFSKVIWTLTCITSGMAMLINSWYILKRGSSHSHGHSPSHDTKWSGLCRSMSAPWPAPTVKLSADFPCHGSHLGGRRPTAC
jgi:hypothetical protein